MAYLMFETETETGRWGDWASEDKDWGMVSEKRCEGWKDFLGMACDGMGFDRVDGLEGCLGGVLNGVIKHVIAIRPNI